MATVTGLTADRMLQIEGSSIVNGSVVSDNLILTRFNGQQVNAGVVRGAKGDQGDQGDKGDKGDKGDRGDDGTGVTILGSYPTYAALIAAHPSGNVGDGYLVNGDLYIWDGSAWQNVGNIKGPKGDTGDTGQTGPKGDKGDKGDQGDPGAPGVFDPEDIPNDAITPAKVAGLIDTMNQVSDMYDVFPEIFDSEEDLPATGVVGKLYLVRS